jgi:hypothetical protein
MPNTPEPTPPLCAELQPLLDAELAAGNRIAYHHLNAGPDALAVMLKKPFKTKPAGLPSSVTHTEVNDPHWWLAEYRCATHRHLLACQFD